MHSSVIDDIVSNVLCIWVHIQLVMYQSKTKQIILANNKIDNRTKKLDVDHIRKK